MQWQYLCAADLTPIPSGQEGIVLVTTRDKENPVSVHVHNNDGCRKAARNHAHNAYAMARRSFDEDGNRRG